MQKRRVLPLALAAVLFAGCAQNAEKAALNDTDTEAVYTEQVTMEEIELEDEAVALAASPAALGTILMPQASGTTVKKNDRAVIDYSNISDGYVMVNFTGATSKRLKVQIAGPSTTYTYDLKAGQWATFPLSDGNGSYKTTVLENGRPKLPIPSAARWWRRW